MRVARVRQRSTADTCLESGLQQPPPTLTSNNHSYKTHFHTHYTVNYLHFLHTKHKSHTHTHSAYTYALTLFHATLPFSKSLTIILLLGALCDPWTVCAREIQMLTIWFTTSIHVLLLLWRVLSNHNVGASQSASRGGFAHPPCQETVNIHSKHIYI